MYICIFLATLSDNIMVEAPGHIAIELSPVTDKIELAFWFQRIIDFVLLVYHTKKLHLQAWHLIKAIINLKKLHTLK